LNIGMLGKRAPKIDARTLKLKNYLGSGLKPKTHQWWVPIGSWPMMLNDTLGDCVPAAAGHSIEQWTALATLKPVVLPDATIEKTYEAVGGYVPGNPATDQGCVMLDMLNYWRKTGVGGHKIMAYADLNPLSRGQVEASVQLFANCYIGIQLPITAQNQDEWEVVSTTGDGAPGSWGGHCVPAIAYDGEGLTVVTWGATKRMSWAFLEAYSDEAYALLSEEWIESNALSPSGFNLPALKEDLKKITGE